MVKKIIKRYNAIIGSIDKWIIEAAKNKTYLIIPLNITNPIMSRVNAIPDLIPDENRI